MQKKDNKIVLYCYQWKDSYVELADYVNCIALPYTVLLQAEREGKSAFHFLKSEGVELSGILPAISMGWHDKKIREAFSSEEIHPLIDSLYIGNPGQLSMVEGFQGKRYGDYGLNIFNASTAQLFLEKGLERIMVSYELEEWNLPDIEEEKIEKFVFGRVPVMVSEYCVLAGGMGVEKKYCGLCEKEKRQYRLIGRYEKDYPVMLDPMVCRSIILSSNVLNHTRDGVHEGDYLRICIFDESKDRIKELIKFL